MHPRNRHKNGYNFTKLTACCPALSGFVKRNPSGRQTIDFSDPNGVKMLNMALLMLHYKINHWDIPAGYLCPPIPGRADYIHHLADLLGQTASLQGKEKIIGLDIGTGANLIYPIIGSQQYGWQFIASDIDKTAIQSANAIQKANPNLTKMINVRHQPAPSRLFHGIIQSDENISFTMCNPPFHTSAKAAQLGTQTKNNNLNRHRAKSQGAKKQNKSLSNHLNFAGKNNELWCPGGEVGFIKRMVQESVDYKHQVTWFTSLVSKKDSLKPLYKALEEVKATEVKTVNMEQGSKISRFIAWQY